MVAWSYCLAYNEAVLIPYWVRHALTFCERAIVYVDTDSDDGTAELVAAEGGEARPYTGSGHLDDTEFVEFANAQYREARGLADWVIWTDADEILYHPRLSDRLAELSAQGVTVPNVAGYNMIADAPPSGPGQVYETLRTGVPAPEYCKLAIFNPRLDVAWGAGKHQAMVGGPAFTDDGRDPLKLLHYRWLGEAWFRARHARNFARLSARNVALRHGYYVDPAYTDGDWYSAAWFRDEVAPNARECV